MFVQQISGYRRGLGFTAILILAFAILGCEQQGDLSVTAVTNGVPEFCLSRQPGCTGGALQVAQIDVSEVDEYGKPISTMWYIERAPSSGNAALERFRYGILPVGWKQSGPARPLRPDTYYAVSGQWFFTFTADGQAHVYNQREFFENMQKGSTRTK
jgi:hypothetical protein